MVGTYCIQPENNTLLLSSMICVVWMPCHGLVHNQHLLASHLCGDGHLSLLINGVGGCSWTIVGGEWVLMVLGCHIHSLIVVSTHHAAKGVLTYMGACDIGLEGNAQRP